MITGDFGRLEGKIALLTRWERRSPVRALLIEMGVAALDAVEEGFKTRSAPSGAPWRASKIPGKGDLREQGRLRRSWRVSLSGDGFALYSTAPYASVHQYGSRKKKIPARPMIPRAGTSPRRWEVRLRAAAKRAARRWLGV